MSAPPGGGQPGADARAGTRVADYDYDLPPALVAQRPAAPRDAARLLVHAIGAGTTEHRGVRELPELLAPGDLLVVNDTRVLPARLLGRRATGGRVELLLTGPDPAAAGEWRALVRPAAKVRTGETLALEEGALEARLGERVHDARGRATAEWRVALRDPAAPELGVVELLERSGRMPLPPYVERPDAAPDERDRRDYQTVFAAAPGAVAAPTAGLHFTPRLVAALDARGVERASVTLHVGPGTFRPVTAERAEDHEMHAESYALPAETVAAVARCRARGGRVVAVGTTSVRALESSLVDGALRPGAGTTRLFVRPGHRFGAIDALLTNFHLPRSTLLMLVAALAGRERVLALYAEAVRERYRFYSYGDAMLLLP